MPYALCLTLRMSHLPEKGYTSIYPKTKEPEELLRKLSNSRFTVCGNSAHPCPQFGTNFNLNGAVIKLSKPSTSLA